MNKKLVSRLGPVPVVVLLAAAGWVSHHQLREFRYLDVIHSLAAIPGRRLCLAFTLTILSYLVLTGYDVLALHYLRRPLTYGRIALASFISYVFSYNIGLSVLGGSAVRY